MPFELRNIFEIAALYVEGTPEARQAATTAAQDSNLTVTDFLRLGAIANAAGGDVCALSTLVGYLHEELNDDSNVQNGKKCTAQGATNGAAASRAA